MDLTYHMLVRMHHADLLRDAEAEPLTRAARPEDGDPMRIRRRPARFAPARLRRLLGTRPAPAA